MLKSQLFFRLSDAFLLVFGAFNGKRQSIQNSMNLP